MTTTVNLPIALTQWAEQAGYTVSQGAQTNDGRAVLSTNLGELRHFIGMESDGWIAITDSDRLGPEQFIFASAVLDIAERYLFGKLGPIVRERLGLPTLDFPFSRDHAVSGFDIQKVPFRGDEFLALLDSTGSTVAISGAGVLMGTLELVRLSYHLGPSVEEIKTSYLDPSGSPLFHFPQRGSGGS